MASRTLEITFLGNPKPLQDAMSQVEGSTGKLSGTLKGVGSAFGDVAKIAGGFVVAEGIMKAPGFLMDAAQAASEDEAATARLEKALRNAGGAFDENKQKVDARIAAGQELAFGDDAVRDSFQQLLGATGDVDEALRRQALAMDFARGAGIPLEQASKLLGKVTEENVEQFKRLGINIGEGATEADAFAVIQGKYAGQAQVYADSTAGQWEQSKIAMGELKESIGTALLPVMAKIGEVLVTNVIPAMGQFSNWWAANAQPAVERFINYAGPAIQAFAQDVKRYWESDLKPALDNLKDAWKSIEPVVKPVIEFVVREVQRMAEVVQNVVGIVVDLIQGDFSGAWDKAKEIVRLFWESITDRFDTGVRVLQELVPKMVSLGADLMGGLRDGLLEIVDRWIWPFFRNLPGNILGLLGDLGTVLLQAGKDLIQGFIDGIQSMGGAVGDALGKIPGAGAIGGAIGFVAGGGGGGYGSSSQQQVAGGGGGGGTAYNQNLVWDPAANAWVYPWEVGQFGTGPAERFYGVDKHHDDAVRAWEQGLGPYPTYTGGREAQTTTVIVQVDGATIAEAVARHEARAY